MNSALDPNLAAMHAGDAQSRLRALEGLYRQAAESNNLPQAGQEVNNHVHSKYSFSPYYPAQIAYMAWKAGLQAVGIMDHDSFSGAGEMVEAGKIVGIGTTCGIELRVSADETPFAGKLLNAPGSPGIMYMAIHGIPLHKEQEVADFLSPIHRARQKRNRAQLSALNSLLQDDSLRLDFDADVFSQSLAHAGGSITERHILWALAGKIMAKTGVGENLISYLENGLNIQLPKRLRSWLADEENPHYQYDLLGLLKSQYQGKFFIQPGEQECIPVSRAVTFAKEIGAIPAYAYLGDVADSPTGDKKAEHFEDAFLDDLMPVLKDVGFLALTFMPPRNSRQQLQRLMKLCDQYDLMQISGVDINSSRQSFHCPEVLHEDFAHLNRSTWALIAHEKLSTAQEGRGLFGPKTLSDPSLPLNERIEAYACLGQQLDLHTIHAEELICKTTDIQQTGAAS